MASSVCGTLHAASLPSMICPVLCVLCPTLYVTMLCTPRVCALPCRRLPPSTPWPQTPQCSPPSSLACWGVPPDLLCPNPFGNTWQQKPTPWVRSGSLFPFFLLCMSLHLHASVSASACLRLCHGRLERIWPPYPPHSVKGVFIRACMASPTPHANLSHGTDRRRQGLFLKH